MPDIAYITSSIPISHKSLSGGLNSTAGPLGLSDTESSDLKNIDFNKFGSILKRNGYTALNASPFVGSASAYGLHWYEYDASGTFTRMAVMVATGKIYKMDALDATWDDITGGLAGSIANVQCDFANFLNEVHICQGNIPYKYNGTAVASVTTPTGLSSAFYNEVFNNYLFIANLTVSGTKHGSRLMWYNLKSNTAITDTDFIDVAKNDGQEIKRIKVLGDRLVVYKDRSIYNVFFTGDSDIPFVLPGGGKSNSAVGLVAPFSVQEVDNGHVFLSYDGLYFYDGMNSYKISDRVTATLDAGNPTKFSSATSLVQKNKNRYWCGLPLSSGSTTENDRVLVWDYFNNSFSLYSGFDTSAMCTFYVNGVSERPYFVDYAGYAYRGDTGTNDYLVGTQTAISSYFWTNWKHYDDIVDKKGIPHLTLFHQYASSTLKLAYAYDLETGDQYSQTFSIAGSADVYGTAIYGVSTYAGAGGTVKRRDLVGRGRVVRFKVENNNISETFQVDGIGVLAHLETKQ